MESVFASHIYPAGDYVIKARVRVTLRDSDTRYEFVDVEFTKTFTNAQRRSTAVERMRNKVMDDAREKMRISGKRCARGVPSVIYCLISHASQYTPAPLTTA